MWFSCIRFVCLRWWMYEILWWGEVGGNMRDRPHESTVMCCLGGSTVIRHHHTTIPPTYNIFIHDVFWTSTHLTINTVWEFFSQKFYHNTYVRCGRTFSCCTMCKRQLQTNQAQYIFDSSMDGSRLSLRMRCCKHDTATATLHHVAPNMFAKSS